MLALTAAAAAAAAAASWAALYVTVFAFWAALYAVAAAFAALISFSCCCCCCVVRQLGLSCGGLAAVHHLPVRLAAWAALEGYTHPGFAQGHHANASKTLHTAHAAHCHDAPTDLTAPARARAAVFLPDLSPLAGAWVFHCVQATAAQAPPLSTWMADGLIPPRCFAAAVAAAAAAADDDDDVAAVAVVVGAFGTERAAAHPVGASTDVHAAHFSPPAGSPACCRFDGPQTARASAAAAAAAGLKVTRPCSPQEHVEHVEVMVGKRTVGMGCWAAAEKAE